MKTGFRAKSIKYIKVVLRPFAPYIIRLTYLRIGNKRIFVNKYTRRIPLVRIIDNRINSWLLLHHTATERENEYRRWVRLNYPKKAEVLMQKQAQEDMTYRPLLSVIMPTYNTKINFLEECIESVINQSYTNWELCIVDDASTDENVRKTLLRYSANDKRIRHVFRKSNGHICKASNDALEMAKGEYVALLDHDDLLWPNALYEVVATMQTKNTPDFIYSDEDKIDENSKVHSEPFFKPDWSFEYLRSVNYITHFSVIRRTMVKRVGGFRDDFVGAQDWDLFLRVSRETQRIVHVPKVIYSWRKSATSTAQSPDAKSYAYENQKKALMDDVKARGYNAKVEWEIPYSMWRVSYRIVGKPKVSIIIPTINQYDFISNCLRTVFAKTTYNNFEVIVVDTGSDNKEVRDLYESLKNKSNFILVEWNEKPFNFSKACNEGARNANGDYLLFLNNDTSVITESWIEDMLGYAQQEGAGAVGCKLYYPDGRLQHAGIILGVGGQNGTPGIAGHFFPAFKDRPPQDPLQLLYVGGIRNFSAVTAACVMIAAKKFHTVKGFDPTFQIAFNDVDLCLKLLKKGWRNIYLPHVHLHHYESVSIGQLGSKQRDPELFQKEINLMLEKWQYVITNDPYYHPAFRRDVASARLRL